MKNKWAVNASPLILLAKVGQLPLLVQLADELVIPASVADEVRQGPADDAARAWIQGEGARWICPDCLVVFELAARDLGAGEISVLNWVHTHREFEALLDDRAARSCAQVFGLNVRGTLGVILAAKQQGLIASAKPVCERLVTAGFRIRTDTLESALRLVGG